MSYDSSKSCWKPWRGVRLDLIFTMRDILVNSNLNPTWNPSLKICFHGTSLKWLWRLVMSYAMKRCIPFWVWQKVNENWNNNMIRMSKLRKATVEQILAAEGRNKPKIVGLWESQSGIRVHQIYQFHQNRFTSLYDELLSLQGQSQQLGWSREPHLC